MSTQALDRRQTRGPGKGGGVAYRTTSEQDAAAALTCKHHALNEDDLTELLAMLGLAP